ncbi:flagellar motor protein MotB [Azospirillum sp. SYSU D00513]|uniref:flagellar motor protein MotB n=1 Tax=Azospirillum sp. SYSU D00513 TaxID=2812561 RepID=UPI001A962E29|nr:flagellar motor protein MotB [Azospirillum sp. SYSU D00513]
MSDTSNVIVVKRRRKKADEAHGGAWKIAYADFVTAMMAFFLLMWLLSSTSKEQKEGIAEFFTVFNTSSSAGSNGLLEGRVIDETNSATAQNHSTPVAISVLPPAPGKTAGPDEQARDAREDAIEKAAEERENREFAETENHLREALLNRPEMAKHMLLERTPEGLRIHIVDQERTPMFALGSPQLVPQADELLRLVAGVVANVPNRISVSGHTDGLTLNRGSYSNWELSADRANAARRILVSSRIPEERILRVLGLADRQPLVPTDPKAPSNRRISILLMSTKAAQSATRQ